jgi:hypothetical protein
MNLSAIEDELVKRIREALPKAIVESSPSDPDAYDGKGRQGCVLVRFNLETYDQVPSGMRLPQQLRRPIQFTLFCGALSLRERNGHLGCYEIYEAVRDATFGFVVPGSNQQQPLRFLPIRGGLFPQPAEKMNGVWWYVLIIEGHDVYQPQ